MAADGVRGKAYLNYPLQMQLGILLHRRIDFFTDKHPLFRRSCRRLYTNYRHYARVIVDIYYDHFLAKNWHNYSEHSLNTFVHDFYSLANKHLELLPPKFQHLTPHMIAGNWLEGYAEFEGIASVLEGMDRRTKMRSKMSHAIYDLKEHYDLFAEDFDSFFKDLRLYAEQERNQIKEQLAL
jgi:acyl carrier protein phosphodiesterase